MKRITISLLGIILIMLWGCSTESTGPDDSGNLNDESAIMAVVADIEASDTEDYLYADLDEQDENEFLTPEASMLLKPIIPLRFGRIGLQKISKDIHIDFTSDSTATAMFKKVLRGNFMVLTMDSAYNPIRIKRKMGHEFTRIAHFVKRGKEGEDLKKRWRLVNFSMVLGESLGIVDSNRVRTTLNIAKVVVEADTIVEIDNPLEFFQSKNRILSFAPGTEVTVKVYVENNSENPIKVPAEKGTELVRLHFARHRKWRDKKLEKHGMRYLKWIGEEDGLNVYQGKWTVLNRFRVHHAVVDVIDNGTIFDDDINAYPYNSVTWSTPYIVKPKK